MVKNSPSISLLLRPILAKVYNPTLCIPPPRPLSFILCLRAFKRKIVLFISTRFVKQKSKNSPAIASSSAWFSPRSLVRYPPRDPRPVPLVGALVGRDAVVI